MAGAAVGVTSIASPAISAADECAVDSGTLQGVLDGLAAPGPSFRAKGGLVEGGVGIIEGRTADRLLKNAYATGTLPVAFNVSPPVCAGNTATSTVSAGSSSQQITFVNEGGAWKLSRGSATTVLSAFS
ncbi:MAG: hypothetical protein ACRDU5_22470 [Mycobacterium sp.]